MAETDSTLTVTILREIRSEIKESRSDTRKLMDLLLQVIDSNRRHFESIDRRFETVDRRFDALQQQVKDSAADVEIMVKSELMGRLAHFETKIDRQIAELEERLAHPS